MSVKVMARVWANSKCSGTELVTVLALADWADDDGWCWPSLTKLAQKARVTVSHVCKILSAIEQGTGEVHRERSTGGKNHRTRYRVTVRENSVTDNSVVGNSVTQAHQTVSPVTHAIIRHRTVNKKESTESDKLIPDSSLTPKEKRQLTRPDPAALAAFDRFYQAYPRHVGRQDALNTWRRLNPDAELIPIIMAAVERYADSVQDTEPRFIKHPGPWLNAKRW